MLCAFNNSNYNNNSNNIEMAIESKSIEKREQRIQSFFFLVAASRNNRNFNKNNVGRQNFYFEYVFTTVLLFLSRLFHTTQILIAKDIWQDLLAPSFGRICYQRPFQCNRRNGRRTGVLSFKVLKCDRNVTLRGNHTIIIKLFSHSGCMNFLHCCAFEGVNRG